MIRKIGSFFILLCLIAGIGRGWHWTKGGFKIQRVRTAFPSAIISSLPEDVSAALNQPYSYLGQGRQYYAFKSPDGNYVLKLPRLDRYEIPFWLQACPFPFLKKYREQVGGMRKSRLDFLMESARIASEELSGQTAVVHLHFYETDGVPRYTVIYDKIGRPFRVDLNRTPFVLQKKKSLMAPAFAESMKKGDRDRSKAILESFLKIIAFRSDKGIFNKDYSYFKNYAFDKSAAFEIDIGSFYRKKPNDVTTKTALQETVEHISPWLEKMDPQLQQWFLSKAGELQNRPCDF